MSKYPVLRPSNLPNWGSCRPAPRLFKGPTWLTDPYGSVDFCRSTSRGYRAHSRALGIVAKMRHSGEIEQLEYDRVVALLYID